MQRLALAAAIVAGAVAPNAVSAKTKCLIPPKAYVQQIMGTGEVGVGTMKALKWAAVKSPDFVSVYFIAIRFSVPGVKSVVGVWSSNRIDGTGNTLSVDAVAQAFSEMADADKTKADISRSDPSVATAKSCL